MAKAYTPTQLRELSKGASRQIQESLRATASHLEALEQRDARLRDALLDFVDCSIPHTACQHARNLILLTFGLLLPGCMLPDITLLDGASEGRREMICTNCNRSKGQLREEKIL